MNSVPLVSHPRQKSGFLSRVLASPLVVVVPFLLLYWADMWRHTMFFDEVNAWAISASSHTLGQLFYYVHFEGHPWLWYFILWFPSRLTHDPVAMKWVEGAFGTAIILIIGLRSPFTNKQRALILASYFLLWEYTVMCRMYSVMLLLVLLYVVYRVRRPEGVLGSCVLLGLAGNTDMTGVLLSGALLVEYAYSSYFGVAKEQRGLVVRRWASGLLVYAVLIGLAVATLWPSKQISWQTSGRLGSQALSLDRLTSSIVDMVAGPWWPLSPEFPRRFWRITVIHEHWLYPLVPVVLFAYWRIFRGRRNLLLLMACTLLFGMVFADVVYPGSPRHWGIAFVSFVVALWLKSSGRAESDAHAAQWPVPAYGLLALSAIAGVLAIVSAWHRPFSQARATAKWIEQNVSPETLVTGAPDTVFASMGEEMQRPMYFLECQCVDTFKLFSRDRENFPEAEIPARLREALDRNDRQSLVFVFYRPLSAEDSERFAQTHLEPQLVKMFAGADMLNDNYFVYSVSEEDK